MADGDIRRRPGDESAKKGRKAKRVTTTLKVVQAMRPAHQGARGAVLGRSRHGFVLRSRAEALSGVSPWTSRRPRTGAQRTPRQRSWTASASAATPRLGTFRTFLPRRTAVALCEISVEIQIAVISDHSRKCPTTPCPACAAPPFTAASHTRHLWRGTPLRRTEPRAGPHRLQPAEWVHRIRALSPVPAEHARRSARRG